MARWTVATVTGLGALAVFGAAASPAGALTPTRTAWWNEAPLGLLVSASPVQPNDLVVAEGTTGPNAVSALYYSAAGAPGAGPALLSVSATLKLTIDSGSSTGTPAITACPVDPSAPAWQAGGGQTGKPPAADCSDGKAVVGQVAADGTSVSFSLTPAQQKTGSPGVFDLVLAPTSQTPFQTAFDPPGNDAFSVSQPAAPPTGAAAQGGQGAPAPSGSSTAPGTDQGSGSAPGSGTSGGSSPDLSGGDLSSVPAVGAPAAPSVPSAGGAAGSAASGTAGGSGGATRVAAGALRPAAATSPGGSGGLFGGRRKQLFGVWLLVDAGLVLFLFGSDQERAPRLLGSMAARRSAARTAEVEEIAPVEVRGIGRFARPRSEPPRRLS